MAMLTLIKKRENQRQQQSNWLTLPKGTIPESDNARLIISKC